jgi:hypothetical protein
MHAILEEIKTVCLNQYEQYNPAKATRNDHIIAVLTSLVLYTAKYTAKNTRKVNTKINILLLFK